MRARKELADAGEFNGPFSIAAGSAARASSPVPSRATIARILSRRGQVRPQPRKRPRSSYRRFQAGRPNEMWQSDWTEWHLTDGDGSAGRWRSPATLDDHSRLLVGIAAGSGDGTGELVWSVMAAAIGAYGVPMSSLTDNGLCYTTSASRPGHARLRSRPTWPRWAASRSPRRPYHPQTCGKIERFWQTLKKWLRARESQPRPLPHPGRAQPRSRRLRRALQHPPPAPRPERHAPRPPSSPRRVKARPAQRPLPSHDAALSHPRQHRRHRHRQPPGGPANCASTSAAATNNCPSPCSKTATASRSSPATPSSAPSTSTPPRPTSHSDHDHQALDTPTRPTTTLSVSDVLRQPVSALSRDTTYPFAVTTRLEHQSNNMTGADPSLRPPGQPLVSMNAW